MKHLLVFLMILTTALTAGSVLAETQPTTDDVVRLVTEKLQAKYRAEVDRTLDRLWDKLKKFSSEDRATMLTNMRRSVDYKINQVRELGSIDLIRRQADLDLLEYIGRKLDTLVKKVS